MLDQLTGRALGADLERLERVLAGQAGGVFSGQRTGRGLREDQAAAALSVLTDGRRVSVINVACSSAIAESKSQEVCQQLGDDEAGVQHQDEAEAWIIPRMRSGALKADEQIVSGFDDIVSAFLGVLRGETIGKTIVQIADDPSRHPDPHRPDAAVLPAPRESPRRPPPAARRPLPPGRARPPPGRTTSRTPPPWIATCPRCVRPDGPD